MVGNQSSALFNQILGDIKLPLSAITFAEEATSYSKLSRVRLEEMIQEHDARSRLSDSSQPLALRYIDLSKQDLRGISWGNIRFDHVLMIGAALDRQALEVVLPDALKGLVNLEEIDLSNQDLSGKMVYRSDIGIGGVSRLSLERLNLRGARFIEANINDIDLDYTNLDGANFTKASIKFAFIRHANVINAEFVEADLTHTLLTGSDMRGSDFTKAILDETDFRDTVL